jgi:hypothetical protein
MQVARSLLPISIHNFQRVWKVVSLLLLSATSTFAADLPAVPVNAPLYSPAPAWNWTGWYVGDSGASASGLVTTPPSTSGPGGQRHADDAFASLGYAPRATNAPPRLPIREGGVSPPSNSVLIFGGQYTTENMENSLNPFSARHENQRIVAAAYQHDFYHAPNELIVGAEIGAGYRFGLGNSEELWAGVSIRHEGFVLFGLVRIAAGITMGLSAVTNTTGIEAQRQAIDHGNGHLLAYLGPELTMALQQYPNLELVYRVQHRSGAFGLIANYVEGANANVFGIRYRF